MNPFDQNIFFELENFSHRALFESCEFVWEALEQISPYLASLPLGQIDVPIPDGVILENSESISIGEETLLEPGAYIRGPCVIGKKCEVRHGAYIRGHCLTGDGCVIGHTTEVKHAIFLDQAVAGHFAYVGNSILGNRINLGAGTKCANLRLAGDEVVIQHEGRSYPTGLRKFGAIIGDDVQLGCNAVTNPGTLIGKGALWYPCVNAGGYVAPGAVVKCKF